MSAPEAAALLNVKKETLYAYTSRGLIRSASLEGTRARRYLRSDLLRVKARKDARSGHGAVAAGALRFGEPVLDSAICCIDPSGHSYRGRSALDLARGGQPFESVAELLWTGALPKSRPCWRDARSAKLPQLAKLCALVPGARPLDAMTLALSALQLAEVDRYDSAQGAALIRARRLAFQLTASAGLSNGADRTKRALEAKSIAEVFMIAMTGRKPTKLQRAAVEHTLVLLADHELNPSSFAARIPASVDADLYACVSASLATLSGPVHGGASERVGALVAEVGAPENAIAVVRDRRRRGDEIPGFGHRLYPLGDPRCPPIMRYAKQLGPKQRVVKTMSAVVDAMSLAGDGYPTVDVALVALAAALRLPPGGAVALFAVGRLAGWIAHTLEQRSAGFTLRPRARYVGP